MHIDPEQREIFVERQPVEQHQNIVRYLRNLPQEIWQPYDWAEFRRRARERTNADARREANNRKYVAIAAALLLVVLGIAAWTQVTRSSTRESGEREVMSGFDGFDAPVSPDNVDSRAAASERWLASLPSEPIVIRVGTRAAVAGLEDRIAQLDDILSAARVEGTQPARLTALEEQRARLVNSLVQVRYAETLVSESR